MLQEISLIVKENSRVVETVITKTNTKASHLAKSLEDFQKQANAALTKMIENLGDSGERDMEIQEEEDSDEDEENVSVSPKKRKK